MAYERDEAEERALEGILGCDLDQMGLAVAAFTDLARNESQLTLRRLCSVFRTGESGIGPETSREPSDRLHRRLTAAAAIQCLLEAYEQRSHTWITLRNLEVLDSLLMILQFSENNEVRYAALLDLSVALRHHDNTDCAFVGRLRNALLDLTAGETTWEPVRRHARVLLSTLPPSPVPNSDTADEIDMLARQLLGVQEEKARLLMGSGGGVDFSTMFTAIHQRMRPQDLTVFLMNLGYPSVEADGLVAQRAFDEMWASAELQRRPVR